MLGDRRLVAGGVALAGGLAVVCAVWRRRHRLVWLKGQGWLVGAEERGVIRFLGVPFASARRWRSPRRPPWWLVPRRSPRVLFRCPQPNVGWNDASGKTVFRCHQLYESESECLNLNVWAPAGSTTGAAGCPIIVYIHGGAGKLLSPHDDDFDGEHLARRHGVVYVALAYRLGALGFLAHPALSAADEAAASEGASEEAGSGNFAMLDLLAGLRWVRAHGGRFGGDVTNVTIWGLSTGAQLVANLLVCPLAVGLFHRAMIQSCVDLTNVRELRGRHDVWQATPAEDWGRDLARALGCERPDPAAELEAFRQVPVEKLIEASWIREATDVYEPCVDPRTHVRAVKPRTSLEALLGGSFHRVPVMIGVTEHDGLGKMELEWTMLEDAVTPDEYRRLLARKFGADRLADALQHYPASSAAEVEGALGAISNDLWYHMGSWAMADLLSGAPTPQPVYFYTLSEPGRTSHGSILCRDF